MRRTVSAEISATTPSRTNWRAISVQSHWDKDRPRSSGRAQAILTTYIATAGGTARPSAGPRAGMPGGAAAVEQVLDPLADMLLAQADRPGHGDPGSPLGDFQDGPAAPGQSQGS